MAFNAVVFAFLHLHAIMKIAQSAQIPNHSHLLSTEAKQEPIVRIKCLSGSMFITIKNAPPSPDDGLFSGMIYPKGLSKNSSCLMEYRHEDGPLKYKLPLRSCNTMPQETDDNGIEFFNTIVLQPHLKLVTDLGRGYHVRCRYKSREAAAATKNGTNDDLAEALIADDDAKNITTVTVDRREHGRSLGTHDTTNEIPMPGCHMKIYSGKNIAENVKIGDPLTLKIYIDKQNVYGMHIMDCNVRDGLGWGEQNLVQQGCPLDGEIMGQFEYSDDRTEASVAFPAHKFPYTASVYYECNIRLCPLEDPECKQAPDCSLRKRTKRDTKSNENTFDDSHPSIIEVYSGLYVNENAEIVEDTDDSVFAEKRPEDALCISQKSFAIAISIAGLVLMLCVVAAVLCIMARRRSKTVSNSGSSIYSGPYTNTAFSHSS
ncbi:cuticlin-1 [Contarinia nasturtii]|uniref:cuticlin-1 n=1 Tax=Contarinia nasturtii TaxID=265458 RepID=UPI0012D41AC8|nr:cuticlin-1 [Contarinia nasturtii]